MPVLSTKELRAVSRHNCAEVFFPAADAALHAKTPLPLFASSRFKPEAAARFVVSRAELATLNEEDKVLVDAYNEAVKALEESRDAHMMTVTLYIISPAARAKKAQAEKAAREEKEETETETERKPLKGAGGTNLVQFLKGVRDQTKTAIWSFLHSYPTR